MLFRGLVAITVLNRNRYNVATYRIMIIQGQLVLCCHVTGGFWCTNHPVIFSYSCCELVVVGLKMYVQCLFGDDTRSVLSACTSWHAHTNKHEWSLGVIWYLLWNFLYMFLFLLVFILVHRKLIDKFYTIFKMKIYIFLYKYLRSSVKFKKMSCLLFGV